MGPTPRPIAERLAEKYIINKETGCWEWQASLDHKGYGRIWVDGKKRLAHRVAYLEFKGPIPAGMSLLHDCDNTICINPNHTTPGTQKKNIQDAMSRGRMAVQRPGWRGVTHPSTKITTQQMEDIRKEYQTGYYSQSELAIKHGLSQSSVSRIILNQQWRQLPARLIDG